MPLLHATFFPGEKPDSFLLLAACFPLDVPNVASHAPSTLAVVSKNDVDPV